MHPTWNTIVKFIPNWIAPNLLTFAGFMCMVIDALLLSYYDYDFTASGKPEGYEAGGREMSDWVLTVCGVLLFLAYNLDGVDGKQARKIGVSGPLGELFDHGLDSYIVFLIPFSLISVFGRDEYSLSIFRGYLVVMSIVLNFYVSHCEKYTTGTLYLPWGYDLSMWVATLLFLVGGIKGPSVYKYHVLPGITFVQVLEVAIHGTGLFTTLPVAIYNVYLFRKNAKGKKKSLIEVLRPTWSMLLMTSLMTFWGLQTPNNIVENDPRAFLLLFGTLFSNIASRLIVSEMSSQRCEAVCWLFWPLLAGVSLSFYQPHLETSCLYALLVLSILAHVHYGMCVVRQICKYYNINCFRVPRSKQK
ncbi:ethanolaminephosphotransferase 1-like [Hyposmocoma kahamanoa]|uniref:ethanolaminephosphotransferase 1-like n=1 Tax=Hyposmocoma kahamanoa TaxID=1477025 RepID=UPI000E6D86C1|nr:ethanolaminephosphotransferase 1-like [Hyposmocoma kahamanoa]